MTMLSSCSLHAEELLEKINAPRSQAASYETWTSPSNLDCLTVVREMSTSEHEL